MCMGRAPNWRMTQWFRQLTSSDHWKRKASCSEPVNSGLPWTSDTAPVPDDYLAMTDVCTGCPVITECARYALADAEGGFYAGVWLPWTSATDSIANRGIRRRARSALADISSRARVGAD